jgi:AcrR family transcriptional regulator
MDDLAEAAGVSRAALYGLFGTRAALLEALGAEEPPSVGERILAAAAELVAERGLRGLSLDDVAVRSGASRATVYRLYPGKAALFSAVVAAYLPIEDALAMIDGSSADPPPGQVMPALGRALAQADSVRIGVLRSALFEMLGREEGSEDVLEEVLRTTEVVTRYLEREMTAGRLRRMDPVVALHAFLGPIMLHTVARPLVEDYGLTPLSVDEAVEELTAAWLRGMTPPRRPGVSPGPTQTRSRRGRGDRLAR